MAYTENSKFGDLLDDPAAKAVLLQYIPQIDDPGVKMMLAMARGMTLKAVTSFPQAKVSAAQLQAIVDALAAI
jgi:hypothetical protein